MFAIMRWHGEANRKRHGSSKVLSFIRVLLTSIKTMA